MEAQDHHGDHDAQRKQQQDRRAVDLLESPVGEQHPHCDESPQQEYENRKRCASGQSGDGGERVSALNQHHGGPADELEDIEHGDQVGAISAKGEPARFQRRSAFPIPDQTGKRKDQAPDQMPDEHHCDAFPESQGGDQPSCHDLGERDRCSCPQEKHSSCFDFSLCFQRLPPLPDKGCKNGWWDRVRCPGESRVRWPFRYILSPC